MVKLNRVESKDPEVDTSGWSGREDCRHIAYARLLSFALSLPSEEVDAGTIACSACFTAVCHSKGASRARWASGRPDSLAVSELNLWSGCGCQIKEKVRSNDQRHSAVPKAST